jgi:hypothetical protein
MYELLQGHTLQLYPNANIRLAMSRTIAVEVPRGWRISKEKQSHKIDVVIPSRCRRWLPCAAQARAITIANTGRADTPSEVLTAGRRDFYGMRFIRES